MLDLHRHEDGYVSFASKNDDYFKPKFAARPSDYQDQGKIPPASIIVRSGRGMWVIWLLRDPKTPDRAQPAFPEKIDLYLTGFLAANVKHSVLQVGHPECPTPGLTRV